MHTPQPANRNTQPRRNPFPPVVRAGSGSGDGTDAIATTEVQ